MQVLCFTPTIQNVLEQLTYQCEVSNVFQTVTAQQTIIYPGSWYVLAAVYALIELSVLNMTYVDMYSVKTWTYMYVPSIVHW